MNALAEDAIQVELYVTGRLSPEEEARFEEAYLADPRLAAQVEAAERLHRGLATAAAQEVVGASVAVRGRRGWRGWRSWHRSALAAGLGAVLVAAVVGFVAFQVGRSQAQVQIQANTPIVHLSAFRSSASAAEPPLLSLPADGAGEWIVFTLEAPSPELPRYQGSLLDAAGATLWQSDAVQPDLQGRLVLSVHSTLLPRGEVEIRLAEPGSTEPLVRFPLRIVAAP